VSRLLHDTPASRVLDDDDRLDEREILARDQVLVRSLQESDLGRVVRIDERITDRHRLAYYERKFSEALRESGVRISLVAETDGLVAGFVMARVDYGEFGQAEATATIDTIGVDPTVGGARIGKALVSQLLVNLGALRVETVRTEVRWQDLELLGFLNRCGFVPAQRLSFAMDID
jgi:ribosomal protein S18 acetylase RimI-like enzyme